MVRAEVVRRADSEPQLLVQLAQQVCHVLCARERRPLVEDMLDVIDLVQQVRELWAIL